MCARHDGRCAFGAAWRERRETRTLPVRTRACFNGRQVRGANRRWCRRGRGKCLTQQAIPSVLAAPPSRPLPGQWARCGSAPNERLGNDRGYPGLLFKSSNRREVPVEAQRLHSARATAAPTSWASCCIVRRAQGPLQQAARVPTANARRAPPSWSMADQRVPVPITGAPARRSGVPAVRASTMFLAEQAHRRAPGFSRRKSSGGGHSSSVPGKADHDQLARNFIEFVHL